MGTIADFKNKAFSPHARSQLILERRGRLESIVVEEETVSAS